MTRQGTGNSNDGNTARRFIANFEETAEILKIDAVLLNRCGTILRVRIQNA